MPKTSPFLRKWRDESFNGTFYKKRHHDLQLRQQLCFGSSYAWSMAKSSPFGKMPGLSGFHLHLLMFPFYYQFYTKAVTYNERPNMKRDAQLKAVYFGQSFSREKDYFQSGISFLFGAFIVRQGFRMTALESSCHKIQIYVKSFSVHCDFSAAG